jgi:hypothetical protein
MLLRNFTFWRKLLGRPETAPGSVVEDDRRLWIRYPANLDSSVQLADHPGEDRIPARIRDISHGGVNLLLPNEFQPGQLISLELPNADDPEHPIHLLACVVRCAPAGDDRFSLGCVFSRELSDDDLFSFGARRVRHAPEDQRTYMRFPCQLTAKFNQVGHDDDLPVAALVRDISARGIGLEVENEIEVGALLNLHVIGRAGHDKSLLACVVHTVQRDKNWHLGCNFIHELSERDFQEMI